MQLVFNEAFKFQRFINDILRFNDIMSRKDINAPDVLAIRLKYFYILIKYHVTCTFLERNISFIRFSGDIKIVNCRLHQT